jgi:hypothetical protein
VSVNGGKSGKSESAHSCSHQGTVLTVTLAAIYPNSCVQDRVRLSRVSFPPRLTPEPSPPSAEMPRTLSRPWMIGVTALEIKVFLGHGADPVGRQYGPSQAHGESRPPRLRDIEKLRGDRAGDYLREQGGDRVAELPLHGASVVGEYQPARERLEASQLGHGEAPVLPVEWSDGQGLAVPESSRTAGPWPA